MVEGRRRRQDAGIAEQDVELAMAFLKRERKPGDAVIVLHVDRNERGGTAYRPDAVVEFLETADGAGDGEDMRALFGQREGGRRANAARGAGDERDAVSEGFGHAA